MLTPRQKRWPAALACAVLVSAAGCRRGSEEPASSFLSEDVPVAMTVTATGDVAIDFDGKAVPAKYTRAANSSQALLGIRPVEAIRHKQGALVPGMSVIPFDGDGTYVVARAAEGATRQAAANSAVSLVWWPTGNLDDMPVQFDQPIENCTIKITKDGTQGHVECPKLANTSRDRTISLEFRWKAPKVKPTTTTAPSPDPAPPTSPPAP